MDILAGLKDKLRFIERWYNAATTPFVETIAKIDKGVAPFDTLPFDEWGPDSDEPPFLEEWLEANESINLIGQAALSLVQSAFKRYLDGFIYLSEQKPPTGTRNWFDRYKTYFLDTYRIDWEAGPIPPAQLEEINLARNDIQHSEQEFGMSRRMDKKHFARFPDGLFASEMDKQIQVEMPFGTPRIQITKQNLEEAIRRVEEFCEFVERHRTF